MVSSLAFAFVDCLCITPDGTSYFLIRLPRVAACASPSWIPA